MGGWSALLVVVVLLTSPQRTRAESQYWYSTQVSQATLAGETSRKLETRSSLQCSMVARQDPQVQLFCTPTPGACWLYDLRVEAYHNDSLSGPVTPCWTRHMFGITVTTPGVTVTTPGVAETTPGVTETTPGVAETTPGNTEILPNNGGPWGSWGTLEYCPSGSFAYGFELKVEGELGTGDDTALNGVRLFCRSGSGVISTETGSITSMVQKWGSWQGRQNCQGDYIKGLQLKVEPDQSDGDDTIANNLNLMCQDGTQLQGSGTAWGDWSTWTECPSNYVVCGLQTFVEADQGSFSDDTALNTLKLVCCYF